MVNVRALVDLGRGRSFRESRCHGTMTWINNRNRSFNQLTFYTKAMYSCSIWLRNGMNLTRSSSKGGNFPSNLLM